MGKWKIPISNFLGAWIFFKFPSDNHYNVTKLWENKKLRFITKIRDFENFVVFWSKVNLPGIVVIDFAFNAFFYILCLKSGRYKPKKLCGLMEKPILNLISIFGWIGPYIVSCCSAMFGTGNFVLVQNLVEDIKILNLRPFAAICDPFAAPYSQKGV